jgi:hypothetical protein
VELDVDLGGVMSFGKLEGALRYALARSLLQTST